MLRWFSSALAGGLAGAFGLFGSSPPVPLSGNPEGGNPIHADGAPPGHTGGFGEPTCQECHTGNAANAPPGALVLAGLPKVYRPNRTYELTVVLTRPAMQAGGFQLSVRSQGLGRQAGILSPADERTAIPVAPLEYLQHSRAGAGLTSADTAQWRFTWRAPQGVGPVVFNVAANAANADDSPLDDFIYTHAIVLQVKP